MRLALTAGGTGGHVIPALAVLDAITATQPETVAAFFGPDDRGERRLLGTRTLPFHRIPSAAMRGRSPVGMIRGVLRLVRGVVAATRSLRTFKPDVVFSTGGYASFPASLAARLLRRPLIVFLPDVSPGWAVRVESRLATRITTTTDAALAFLPRNKTVVTGYPLRPEFTTESRQSARAALGLDPRETVLLVAGASQGARAIDEAVARHLDDLCRTAHVVHVTAGPNLEAALAGRSSLTEELRPRYDAASFRTDLPLVMLAADLAVMRAGASVLGELPAAGLPAILVPGTFGGGHQRTNADWLVSQGAAVVLEDSELDRLPQLVGELLSDAERLERMRVAARRQARPRAADDIAAVVLEAAE